MPGIIPKNNTYANNPRTLTLSWYFTQTAVNFDLFLLLSQNLILNMYPRALSFMKMHWKVWCEGVAIHIIRNHTLIALFILNVTSAMVHVSIVQSTLDMTSSKMTVKGLLKLNHIDHPYCHPILIVLSSKVYAQSYSRREVGASGEDLTCRRESRSNWYQSCLLRYSHYWTVAAKLVSQQCGSPALMSPSAAHQVFCVKNKRHMNEASLTRQTVRALGT